MRPTAYIPNFNGAARLVRTLESLQRQTRPIDIVVVDNGSSDDSAALVRERFPEASLLELDRNLGFGPALNRAIEWHPADPVILVNNDVECEPQFVEAMLNALDEGTQMVAGVLLQETAPDRIDSAGVVADVTLMSFDYLHGEPAEAARGAPPPLGPTGGAALYRLAAFDAVGGFDDRIFLYYEDLDLALRLSAAGARCNLAADARAIHAFSASLGAGSSEKYSYTGWGRGYMLRRYGVMYSPRRALRALACEAAMCAGQLAKDHTAKGITGRLRGWRAGAGLKRRHSDDSALLDISTAQALKLRRRRHSN